MAVKYSAFSYKQGNSFIHRLPAVVKILLIPSINILFFLLPPVFSVILIIMQCILAFILKFSVKEQLADLKPVVYYAFLLYLTSLIANFFTGLTGSVSVENVGSLLVILKNAAEITFQNSSTVIMLVKLFCIMQSASIIFKTSTSLEIRNGIGAIEGVVRKILHLSPKKRFTNVLSLFVCFIPMVFKIWEQSKRAWLARHGKNGIKMYMVLLPVLFSVGMKQAYNFAKAVAVRDA